jgi:hypothetical protein
LTILVAWGLLAFAEARARSNRRPGRGP